VEAGGLRKCRGTFEKVLQGSDERKVCGERVVCKILYNHLSKGLVKYIFMVLIKILLVAHLKHSSFGPSAYGKPM